MEFFFCRRTVAGNGRDPGLGRDGRQVPSAGQEVLLHNEQQLQDARRTR